MIILGINAYHADAAAAILVDGKLIAAAEEERFRRIKHWAGFPTGVIRYCLSEAGVSIHDVDYVAVSRDPKAHFWRKVTFALGHRPKWSYLADRMRNRARVRDVKSELLEDGGWRREGEGKALEAGGCSEEVGEMRFEGKGDTFLPQTSNLKPLTARIHHVEHHRAHMASGFFVSPFDRAAVISVDALGDYTSTMWGVGEGGRMEVGGKILFPHSLGFLYTAATQYLGFPKYGDEYKVMGLAAYGEPEFLDAFRKIIRLKKGGTFELDLRYFRHHTEGVSMSWDGEPALGPLFSDQWECLLGPARKPDEEITKRHENLAASVQAVFEEVYFSLLNKLYKLNEPNELRTLCLTGGCAMNSVANGKISDRTPFEKVYIPPAPGDSGTAIGAAYDVYHRVLGRPRSFVMDHASWGPTFDNASCRKALEDRGLRLEGREDTLEAKGWRSEEGATPVKSLPQASNLKPSAKVVEILKEDELCRRTAQAIADGKIVGWFQGRMEWGPRALGNRSILADPRRAEMKDALNARIKRREPFRPFAPSILAEAVGDYFEKSDPDPFMLKVYPVKKEKRSVIPAVTHVDGTGRLQTVDRTTQPLYWKLIKAFEKIAGVPVVLNTSFNENEPIVGRPEEAMDCFLRTKMDVLVMGNLFIERVGGGRLEVGGEG